MNENKIQPIFIFMKNSSITKQFDQRSENIFQLKKTMTEKQIHFARSTLSNLIGGISYFTDKFYYFTRKCFL